MMRETKIGLLVGLAFIIVIGILLSDHLTTSNEPPPAQLAQAGASIRGGIVIPGAQAAAPAVVVPPANVTPQATVPTPGDLAPKPPVQQIAIGPGIAQPAATAAEQPQPAAGSQEAAPVGSEQGPLAVAAAHQGEQLVPVAAVGHEATRLVPQNSSNGRTYQAVAGDTLSGIAAKLPGGNTKANREALIALNPDLKANPNLIVAGRTYNLPAAAATAKAAPQPAPHSAQAAATPQRWYTVKPGDSLWKIANEQTGSAATLDTIRRLNKETLNGKDVVRVGMKLRLPAHSEVATTD
jgi:nucleoid-associated protein YgaU